MRQEGVESKGLVCLLHDLRLLPGPVPQERSGQVRGQRLGRTSVAADLLRRPDAPGRTDQVHQGGGL